MTAFDPKLPLAKAKPPGRGEAIDAFLKVSGMATPIIASTASVLLDVPFSQRLRPPLMAGCCGKHREFLSCSVARLANVRLRKFICGRRPAYD